MEMVNMKQVTNSILENIDSIKKSSTDYPAEWNIFPSAVYRTSKKPHFIDNEGNELQSFWTITVEMYSNGTSLTPVADELVSRFKEIGFQGNSRDANTAILKCVVCEFSAVIDNKLKYVFQK